MKALFGDKTQEIVNKWFERIIESYPADAARLMTSKKDHFANPVGSTIRHALEGITNEIIAEPFHREAVAAHLDEIVRIRAVQSFSPSDALSFLFRLKDVLADVAEGAGREFPETERKSAEDMTEQMVLMSFDIYMKCREKIYEIKANEAKSMTFRLLQRANLLVEKQGKDDSGMENDKETLNIK